jgi:hypothetical protein
MKLLIKTALVFSVFLTSPLSAQSFDQETVNALKVCHDYVWFEVPDFKDLPNAAVSVYPGIVGDGSITVFWNVMWDDPTVRAAGNCTSINGKVEGFEDYTKLDKN